MDSIAINRHRQVFVWDIVLRLSNRQRRVRVGLDPNDRGIGTGIDNSTGAHHVVVLAVNPVLGGNRRPTKQLGQGLLRFSQSRDIPKLKRPGLL